MLFIIWEGWKPEILLTKSTDRLTSVAFPNATSTSSTFPGLYLFNFQHIIKYKEMVILCFEFFETINDLIACNDRAIEQKLFSDVAGAMLSSYRLDHIQGKKSIGPTLLKEINLATNKRFFSFNNLSQEFFT